MAWRPLAGVAAAATAVAMLAAADLAAAAPARCTFSGGPRVLEIVVKRDPAEQAGTRSGLAYVGIRSGFIAVFAGSDLDRVDCRGPSPTPRNVDTIRAYDARLRSTLLYVDQRRGLFAPGSTDEGDGSSEIEFDLDLGPRGVGYFLLTRGSDSVLVRSYAVGDLADLNMFEAVTDFDVLARQGTSLFLDGGRGDDLLGASAAPPGPYEPYLASGGFGVGLFGGGGDDFLAGSQESDVLVGGPGHDLLSAGDGDDVVVSAERRRQRDRVDCGAGRDQLEADRVDAAAGCERRTKTAARVARVLRGTKLIGRGAPDHIPLRLRP